MTRPCSKIAYTQHEAERALRHIQKRPVRPDQRKRTEDHIYRCPRCHEWHLTSEDQTEGHRPPPAPPSIEIDP